MIEFSEPVLFHSIIPTQAFQCILIAYQNVIFMKERSTTKFNRDTEEFFNPKVEVTVEGLPNELYMMKS